MVKHNSLVNRFDDDFTVKFEEFTGPARIDEKQPNVIIMPVKEEAFVSTCMERLKEWEFVERLSSSHGFCINPGLSVFGVAKFGLCREAVLASSRCVHYQRF